MKINIVKILNIAGTALGIAASLLSGYASDKKMEKLIEDKIKEYFENHKG